jgi:hypothetical protein
MSLLGFDAPGRLALGQISAIVTLNLPASAAFYLVTGNAAGLSRDFEAWLPGPFDHDDWMARTIQSEAWMPRTKLSETWTAQAKQAEPWTPAVKHGETWTIE